MAEESLEGKWSRIDERTRIILENLGVLTKKMEDLQTAVQDMYINLSAQMDIHEKRDDSTFMTRREGGVVAATVTFLATVLTMIGIFWK